jgi:conjugal transfer pilus assembly protein TraW
MVRKFFLFAVFSLASCRGEDLGTFGETFEIGERDMEEEISEKLRRMEADGSMERERQKMRRQAEENVRNPKAVEGIEHATEVRIFEFDPTVELQRDLKDHRGKIFARRGQRFNPLDMIGMIKPLLFIDGDDEDHIDWARRQLKSHPTARVILVRGSPFGVEKQLKRDIFFDQHGRITSRLDIKRVPAVVYREEGKKVLTVKEMPALPPNFSKFPLSPKT